MDWVYTIWEALRYQSYTVWPCVCWSSVTIWNISIHVSMKLISLDNLCDYYQSQIGELGCIHLHFSCSSVLGAAWVNPRPLPFFPQNKIYLSFFFAIFLIKKEGSIVLWKYYWFLAGKRAPKNTMKSLFYFPNIKIQSSVC